MPNKYLGKYRNESTRAPWWDYSCNGAYLLPFVPKTGKIILRKLWQVKCIIQKLEMWPLQNGL